MAFSAPNTNKDRKNHGDVIVHIEEVSESQITGTNHETGEEMTISLASPVEIAKFFQNRNNSSTFNERVEQATGRIKNRWPIDLKGSIQEGSVMRFENVRTFPDGDATKTAAFWQEALVRDPKKEAFLAVDAEVQFQSAKDAKGEVYERPFINLYDTDSAVEPSGFDFDAAFTGDFKGVSMNTSGVTVTVRDENNHSMTSSLTTNFRNKADPSIDSALDKKPLDKFTVLAAAVVAAATGRDFNELPKAESLSEQEIDDAQQVFMDVRKDGGEFEIQVVALATTQLLPKDATKSFMSEYHGTHDGKLDPKVAPDKFKSYKSKGVTPSIISLSAHPTNPDIPMSIIKMGPENKFNFAEQPKRYVHEVMEEAMADRIGSSFGDVEAEQEGPDQKQNMQYDSPTSP